MLQQVLRDKIHPVIRLLSKAMEPGKGEADDIGRPIGESLDSMTKLSWRVLPRLF